MNKICIGERCPVYVDEGCGFNSSNLSPNKKEGAPYEKIVPGKPCLHPEILDEQGRIKSSSLEDAAKRWLGR
ncbi:hypothetical protein FJZ19_02835 [Candidatus Pacearchaeota archaeon]|nr:hypothetical protein [Candidatus Pacearchaeota archaeon]